MFADGVAVLRRTLWSPVAQLLAGIAAATGVSGIVPFGVSRPGVSVDGRESKVPVVDGGEKKPGKSDRGVSMTGGGGGGGGGADVFCARDGVGGRPC